MRSTIASIRLAVAAAALTAMTLYGAAARAADEAPTVLTGNQATYSLAAALTAGTPIRIVNVPADGRSMALLRDYIARRLDALAPTFASATAVITLTNALPGDPLYRYARRANVRIVPIDAAVPWSFDTPGVALADTPVSNVSWSTDPDVTDSAVSPFVWLSVTNVVRMADLIADDLMRLFPDSAAAIAANLDGLKRSLLMLRNDYQARLIESGADLVFALTDDFVYLTNDLGLFVDGYFIKQDVRWTEADLAALTQHLKNHGIKVVLHEWQPSEAIQNAIRAGGATLVVLDTGDTGVVADGVLAVDGLQQILRKNFEAIVAATTRD